MGTDRNTEVFMDPEKSICHKKHLDSLIRMLMVMGSDDLFISIVNDPVGIIQTFTFLSCAK